ncbi:hypothetical protein GF327_04375 [Candidatus Woesearchaeota archaeon]|nr:hypothetical protein [Candidatus Woesearchaeota archaeon]
MFIKMPEFTTAKSAVSKIKSNSLIVFSGMQLNRSPMQLVYELIRQNINTTNKFSIVGTPNPIPMDMMIGADLVSEIEFCFMGYRYEYGFFIPKHFRSAVEKKEIDYIESGAYSIMMGLRAGAMNLDIIQLKNFEGSDLLKIKNKNLVCSKDPFSGKKVLLRRAVKPDFALIHAQYADKKGNIYIEDELNERLIAKASKKVIVSVEKIKEKINKNPAINSFFVDYIIEMPQGAFPSSCYKFYNYKKEIIRDYEEKSFTQFFNLHII